MSVVRRMPSYAHVVSLTVLAALLGALLSVVPTTAAHAAPVGVPVPVGQAGQVVSWGDTRSGLQDLPPELAPRFTQIASGSDHSLALTSDGQIHAWGYNWNGQTTIPTSLDGQHVTAIAAGHAHSLALTDNGQLHAWGSNTFGQTTIPTSLDDQHVTAIAAGSYHSLALTDDGQIHAWGDDGFGQATLPASLNGQHVTAIAAGHAHSLALTDNGQIQAWGSNGYGETTIPTSLDGQRVTAIAAGYTHSLALTDNGQLHAWGSNTYGQTTIPTSLNGHHVTAIAAGGYHSLALTDNGQIHAWGNNASRQTTLPTSLNDQHVTAIAAGGSHSLALTDNGQIHAWGNNRDRQTDVPQAPAGKPVTAIAAGYALALALADNGQIHAWGNNAFGQTTLPTSLNDQHVTAIAAGAFHSLALTDDGQVHAWGNNGFGQTTLPTSLDGQRVTAIAAGDYHSLALTDNGQVHAWGNNGNGQTTLPASLNDQRVTAIAAGGLHSLALTDNGQLQAWGSRVSGLTTLPTSLDGQRVTAIAGGGGHSLALTENGQVHAWGRNGSGQTTLPTSLNDQHVTAIAGGADHSLALTENGQIHAWGNNGSGEITLPTSLDGQHVTAIAGGGTHSVAIVSATDVPDLVPTVTGSGVYHSTLSATPGTGTPTTATTAYQWNADGTPIPGATGTTFTINDPALIDQEVTVTATTSQLAHSPVTRTSSGTQIANGTQTGDVPTITGDPIVDSTLTAAPGDAMTDADVSFQWSADGDAITDATGTTLAVTPAMVGKTITVTTTASLAGYDNLVRTSTATDPVTKADFTKLDVTITGTPKVGETVTADVDVAPTGTLTYVWKADGDPIADATGDTLEVTPDLAGTDLTVTVTATKTGYNDRTETSDTVTVANGTQSGTTPTITGDAIVDSTLTATAGDTMDDAAVSFQWHADGDAIDDATGTSLTVTPAMVGKTITVTTTAVLDGYNNLVRTSTATAPVTKADFTQLDVTIDGNAKVGETVTADVDHSPNGALTYVWKADGDIITDATGDTLALTPDLAGKDLTVTVTATKAGYNDRTETSDTVTIANGTQSGTKPTITGTPIVDSTLTAVAGDTMTDADVSFQWSADGDPITDATSTTLGITPALVGKTITVTTTATLAGYTNLVRTSSATDPVTKADFTQLDVTITGTPKVGETVTADVDVAPTGTLTYVWKADGDPIADATGDTLEVTPDLAGTDLTITVTATKAGYNDRATTSDTVTVGNGTQTGDVPTITGTPVVGGTLTATFTGTDLRTLQWFADGTPIPGATGAGLPLTADLLGQKITVATTSSTPGYEDLVLTSDPTTPVAAGTQSGTTPTITGDPVVDATLTATPGDTMDGATVTYQWAADDQAIDGATGTTLAVTPALVGKTITVTTTATLTGYDNLVRTSSATTPVTRAALADVAVTITGTAKAGEPLTATTTSTPAANAVTWEWKRGNTTVGTDASYQLTDDDEGKSLTVTATLTSAGYENATATATTAMVATRKAPSLTLNTDRTKMRLGQKTDLTWTSDRATTVTGDWTQDALTTNGTTTITPTTTGRQIYTVTATNANGTTTATTTIAVALPKTTLTVTTKKKVTGTKKYTVRINGLAPRETFTVRQGKQRLTGTATVHGTAKIRMTAPKKNKTTQVKIKVTGSLKDRTGHTHIRVQPHRITAKVAYTQVRASDTQVITLTGLAKHEKVTLRHRGQIIHTARATTRGTLTHRFKVGTTWGTETITARAHRTNRTAKATFTIGRRCTDGIWRCP